MGESRLRYATDCRFRRPVEVVRAQFLDMRHHVDADVHHGVRYTILAEHGDRCRVRQEFRVLGLRKVDELELRAAPDNVVIQDYLVGDFAGGRLTLWLTEDGPSATRVHAELDVPLRGVNRLMKPLLLRTVRALFAQALEEDRVDLEDRRYQPPAAAASAAAPAPAGGARV